MLRMPLAAFGRPERVNAGSRFGSLFRIPGIGETLRINGLVASVDMDEAVIEVEEIYGHYSCR